MAKVRRKFTKEFKLEIVKRSLEDEVVITELAKEYQIHPNQITNWRRKYLQDGEYCFPGNGNEQLGDDEAQQIKDLEKRLKEAEMERDILKKAIRIFSKNDGKSMNS
ncbi:MAG: transposase [Chitinophagales bacterium]|nr:transposase [Chitinophagales bacterium]